MPAPPAPTINASKRRVGSFIVSPFPDSLRAPEDLQGPAEVGHQHADDATIAAWVSSPLVAILLIALIGIGCYHFHLGLQVIVEDYVHGDLNKLMTLLFCRALAFLIGLSGIYAVLRISFGGL
jgi:succinate dehydrogenase / fumarate reductase membrane anchor subunit